MKPTNWREVLGWGDKEMDELRFVGYAYAREGKYDIAMKIFEGLVIVNPSEAYGFQTLGAIYLQTGNHISALNHLETALRLDPDHMPTHMNRIKTLFSLGYKHQAISAAQQFINHPDLAVANQAQALMMAYS